MASADDSDIPETGAVFTFGKSKFAENLPNKFWVKNDRVVQVACGDEHTALVADSGRVFMFGPNDWGQLGIATVTTANKPSCIKSLKQEKSKLVACGRLHTIVATESGKVYTFGSNSEGQLGIEGVASSNVPKHVESLPSTAYKMLAAGCDHSMALTEDGRVFVWGGSSEGQLGLGEEEEEVPVPRQLDVGQRVVCIACGYYHSALVTESGELYTFGESDGGKLGLGEDTAECKVPQHVMAIPDRVMAVSCGGSHTAVLTEKGQLYTFGAGPDGQLGLGVEVYESISPSLVKLPFKIAQVCCGENFTAAISEKGQLYTFGDGRHGKLALGQESFSNQFSLKKVLRFQKFVVRQVACGGCHMIVTANRRLENGDGESEDEDEEILENGTMNGDTAREGRGLSLSRSFSARQKRRDASPVPLSRTLPALSRGGGPALSATMPPIKTREHKADMQKPLPRLQRAKNIEKMSEGEESEEKVSEEEEENKEIPTPKAVSRKLPPKPSLKRMSVPAAPKEEEEDEEEEEEEDADEEEEEKEKTKKGKKGKKEEKEEDKKKEKDKKKKKDKKNKKDKKKGKKEEEEEEEEEDDDEEENEDEEEGKTKKDKKDKKSKKKEKEKKGKKGKEDEEDGEETEKENKDKKKAKDKGKTKTKKGEKDENENNDKVGDEEEEEDKDKEKEETPTKKKKSSFCTLL